MFSFMGAAQKTIGTRSVTDSSLFFTDPLSGTDIFLDK